jgi:hypothetical protein
MTQQPPVSYWHSKSNACIWIKQIYRTKQHWNRDYTRKNKKHENIVQRLQKAKIFLLKPGAHNIDYMFFSSLDLQSSAKYLRQTPCPSLPHSVPLVIINKTILTFCSYIIKYNSRSFLFFIFFDLWHLDQMCASRTHYSRPQKTENLDWIYLKPQLTGKIIHSSHTQAYINISCINCWV